MKVKEEHKKVLLEEFEFVSRMMRETPAMETKLFYFSAIHGGLSRIFNLNFDSHLVFMHNVLNSAYSTIMARIAAAKSGDLSISLPDDFFDKLSICLDELAQKIKENKPAYDTLERISLLTFATTGNGYYLMKRGAIKL
jgi:hypothetical protein